MPAFMGVVLRAIMPAPPPQVYVTTPPGRCGRAVRFRFLLAAHAAIDRISKRAKSDFRQ
jgi:hypothetical protein